MKIYLVDSSIQYARTLAKEKCKYLLLSYYYFAKNDISDILNECSDIIIDSGVFTMLKNKSIPENMETYICDYIKFLKIWKIKQYIELDLYDIIGTSETERIRERIENEVSIKSIPVFHRSQGLNYFYSLLKKYEYIALGGLAIKDIKQSEYSNLQFLINEAARHGVKMHGLGFCNQKELRKYKFHSIDTSSWNCGRFGGIAKYSCGYVRRIHQKDKYIKNSAEVMKHNGIEWIKFQRYADRWL